MLPLSLGRTSTLSAERRETQVPLAWLHPANIAAATSAELRALVTWLAVFVALGVVVALGHVWLRLKVVDLGYRLSATKEVIKKLEQEERALTVDVETLHASGRLEELARTKLGMLRPEKGQEVVLP